MFKLLTGCVAMTRKVCLDGDDPRVLEYVLRQRRNFNCFHIGSRYGLVVIQGAFV